MQLVKTSLVVAAAAVSFSALAQVGAPAARPGNCPASAPCAQQGHWAQKGPRVSHEQMQQRFDQRAAAQAQALGITAAQRPAWDAFVQTRKDMYQSMPMANGDRQARHQAMQAMTPDQRAQFMADQMKARSEQMQKVADATKKLRDSLTAEQRAKFDQLGPQQRGWGPKGGPRGDGPGRAMGPRDGNWQGRGMGPRGGVQQQAPAQNNPFAPKQ